MAKQTAIMQSKVIGMRHVDQQSQAWDRIISKLEGAKFTGGATVGEAYVTFQSKELYKKALQRVNAGEFGFHVSLFTSQERRVANQAVLKERRAITAEQDAARLAQFQADINTWGWTGGDFITQGPYASYECDMTIEQAREALLKAGFVHDPAELSYPYSHPRYDAGVQVFQGRTRIGFTLKF